MITPRLSPEVSGALTAGGAVVALESTIFSNLGLPSPSNAEALERCISVIRASGAVPAVTAVLDGVPRVGLLPTEHERILGAARKVAERDLAVAIGERWAFGATTVSASLALAAAAGIRVFATGGIGGVHRGAELHGDVSADLAALAHHSVVTVSAGAKSFLDLPRTLEMLETLGVPVVGHQCSEFPAFTVVSSGIRLPHRVDDLDVLSRVAATRLQIGGGMLVCTPVPADDAVDSATMNAAIASALKQAEQRGATGPEVTPIVLAKIAHETSGEAVRANLSLAHNNARLAAEIATRLAVASR